MEEIEVPSHFLCPISLQLMKDPVTISTGITYDRDSIERWLFSSSAASCCPVTKLPISATDRLHLIPNHNLRRLIQSWCILNSSHGVERIPTPKSPVDVSQISKLIAEAKRHPSSRKKCLQRLKSMVEDRRNRKHVEAAGGVLFLALVIAKREDMGDVRDALMILHQLEPSDSELRSLINEKNHKDEIIDSLIHVLGQRDQTSDQTYSMSISLLHGLYRVADPNQLMSASQVLFTELITFMINSRHITANKHDLKSCLKLLSELNPWGRNRVKSVEAGAVNCIIDLLLDLENNERRLCELALNVLDQLCRCAEGRAELVQHEAGIAVVAKKILRVSNAASDRAVKVLGSVARNAGSGKVVAEMAETGAVAKLCLVLQVECGIKTKERAKEILRLHSRAWKRSPCLPAHLMISYPSC